jgi:hypothetical protein
VAYIFRQIQGLPKKYPTISFSAVSNGERVGKLSVVVEGTFMRMCDFFCYPATLPDAWSSNTA